MTRRARIVATLGPATADPAVVDGLVAAGVDVARLNLSHGTHDEHRASIAAVRAAAHRLGRAVAVLADLQGPKVRLGTFPGGARTFAPGATVRVVDAASAGTGDVAVDHPGFTAALVEGAAILLADGAVTLEVTSTGRGHALARVVAGGTVRDRAGVVVPGADLGLDALTGKDRDDLAFALDAGADLVALSFVRRAADAGTVREAMGARRVPVIAKLEREEAVDDLAAIVDAFDGIMVARGDLGLELPLERVPLVQKVAVAVARAASRPAIVATQMLESMVQASRPTRAEVSDVANAVLDGADAVMLSAETSVGIDPVNAVRTMGRVVEAAEVVQGPPLAGEPAGREEAVAAAAVQLAATLDAPLVAFTTSGSTARRLARHRPRNRLLAFTPDEAVRRRLALTWGVEPHVVPHAGSTDEMISRLDGALGDVGFRAGDTAVVVAGTPPGEPGTTNLVRVHTVGEARRGA